MVVKKVKNTTRPKSAKIIKKKSSKKKASSTKKKDDLVIESPIAVSNDKVFDLVESGDEKEERPRTAKSETSEEEETRTEIDEEETIEPFIPEKEKDSKGIKVFCRVRPLLPYELEKSTKKSLNVTSEKTLEVKRADSDLVSSFEFNRIFDETSSQKGLYAQVGAPAVNHLLDGFNASIIAYGQTGSGKTFTMQGAGKTAKDGSWIPNDPSLRGIIPRVLVDLFERIKRNVAVVTTVRAAFVEIYLEKINDLISGNSGLELTGTGNIWVGATQVPVKSSDEVLRVMGNGLKNRKVASHKLNDQSSRSHSIFVLTVEQVDVVDSTVKRSQLYLVDLAGSEQANKTKAAGHTLLEASRINTSLLALRKVIFALSDKKVQRKLKKNKNYYFGYRDSVLTRIMKNSLGGNAKASIIVNVSPSIYNAAETISTLRFGQRSAKIKNKPTVNKEISPEELKKKLAKAEEALASKDMLIRSLRAELQRARIESSQQVVHIDPELQRATMVDARSFNSFFICPLTRQVMMDPVIAMDGHTYEKQALIKHFKRCRIARSPLNGRPIHSTLMIPNLTVRTQMNFFQSEYNEIFDNVDYSFYWRPGDALPEDIVKVIFTYLEPKAIQMAASVCTLWNRCARSRRVWKPIFARYFAHHEDEAALVEEKGSYYEAFWAQAREKGLYPKESLPAPSTTGKTSKFVLYQ